MKAAALWTIVAGLLPTGSCTGSLPATEVPFVQADGITCGFYVLARMGEAYSVFRGQKFYRCYKSVAEIRKSLNAFVQTLLVFQKQQAKKAEPPPPLPPPTDELSCSAAAAVAVPPGILAASPGGEYGCSKCRWSACGCGQCRNLAYKGPRWNSCLTSDGYLIVS